jgi:hypothetical protein
VALVSERNDPVLAHAHYGLGRVVAWTPDAGDQWAGRWLEWPSAGPFFAQALRWSLAAPGDRSLRVESRVEDRDVTLAVESLRDDGGFSDGLDTRATLVAPNGQTRDVELPAVGPGMYQARVRVDWPGLYRATVRQVGPDATVRETSIGFAVDEHRELRAVGTNRALLNSLASQTNGRALEEPSQAFDRQFEPRDTRAVALWPWLLIAALVLFPVEVALRRLDLPRIRLRRVEALIRRMTSSGGSTPR